MNILIGLVAAAAGAAAVRRKDIAAWLRSTLRRWQASRRARRPVGQEEMAAIIARCDALSLPAIALQPSPRDEVQARGTRLGGPAWLADREAWPVGPGGAPLEFLAQLDFESLPHLPDFPTSGLLQIFVASDDLYGANLDDPAAGRVKLIWRPAALVGGALHPQAPPVGGDGEAGVFDYSPFSGAATRFKGLPLAGRPFQDAPDATDWRVEELVGPVRGRPGAEQIERRLEEEEHTRTPRHHVGGHPAFTQHDFRRADYYGDYDRTLLRLTSDDHLMWGDAGEAVFLIRRADLLARDFSAVAFSWDCG